MNARLSIAAVAATALVSVGFLLSGAHRRLDQLHGRGPRQADRLHRRRLFRGHRRSGRMAVLTNHATARFDDVKVTDSANPGPTTPTAPPDTAPPGPTSTASPTPHGGAGRD
jgi:hypothetical protein